MSARPPRVGVEGWRRAQRSRYDQRMTNPMTKILLALFTLAMLTGTALAQSPQLSRGATGQQRTFYDSRGNVVGRSATDSQGSTTVSDAQGQG